LAQQLKRVRKDSKRGRGRKAARKKGKRKGQHGVLLNLLLLPTITARLIRCSFLFFFSTHSVILLLLLLTTTHEKTQKCQGKASRNEEREGMREKQEGSCVPLAQDDDRKQVEQPISKKEAKRQRVID
jgi:hypothetical protein